MAIQVLDSLKTTKAPSCTKLGNTAFCGWLSSRTWDFLGPHNDDSTFLNTCSWKMYFHQLMSCSTWGRSQHDGG